MKWLFFCILTIIGAYFYWRYSGTVQKNQPEASSAGKPTQSDDLSTGGALESNPNVSPENSLRQGEPFNPSNPNNSGEMGSSKNSYGDSPPLTVPQEYMAQPPNNFGQGFSEPPNSEQPLEPPPPPPQGFPQDNDSFDSVPPAFGGGGFEPPPQIEDPNGGFVPPPPPIDDPNGGFVPPPPPMDEGEY